MSDEKYMDNERSFRRDRGMDGLMEGRDGEDRWAGGRAVRRFLRKKYADSAPKSSKLIIKTLIPSVVLSPSGEKSSHGG